jgi:formamidopyrimidine-DNA glycosylase
MESPQTRALAEHLNDFLTGKPVEQILVPENRWQANMLLINCVGQVIQRVRSHGKWLFFDFSHGITWLCQLVARARWTLLSREEMAAFEARREGDVGVGRGARRRPLITLMLRGAGAPVVAVLTGHPLFYILPTAKVWSHPEIQSLGPDPLASPGFHDMFPFRLRQTPGRTVAAGLLDQEVVAGIGNMLKCEILFAMRFAPSLKVGDLLASQIDHLSASVVGLVATSATFATRGEPFPRRVFDRAGLPCAVCVADITADRSGQDAHLTWYCPRCQPLGAEPTLFTP